MTEIWVKSRQRIRVIWCQLMEFLTIVLMDEICNVYNVFESQYENYLEMVAASNELINNVEQNLYTVNMHFLMIEKIFIRVLDTKYYGFLML